MNKIRQVVHPEAYMIQRAWVDEAIVTRQPYVEKPFWYENIETGQLYHNIYGCIGWPTEVSEKDDGLPGYAGVVGVVKSKIEGKLPQDALFQLLTEIETRDIPTMLDGLLSMREDFGFRVGPNILTSWFGDPERFTTAIALLNERLTGKGDPRLAIVITPPDDFYIPKAFDHYVRSMRSVITPDKVRFYFGKNEILRNRLKSFRQNDPAVQAIGGLVHSLLSQTMWMDHIRESMFVVQEEGVDGYEYEVA